MLKKRSALGEAEKAELDRGISDKLMSLVHEKGFRSVHTFLPMGTEVDIYPAISDILAQGITVVSSRSLPGGKLQHLLLRSLDELEEGIFGTRYPATSEEYTGSYDMIIVPGLAFDQYFNRLGYGAGYYDRFLRDHSEAYKLAVCYPFQVVEHLPVEEHDVPLDALLY